MAAPDGSTEERIAKAHAEVKERAQGFIVFETVNDFYIFWKVDDKQSADRLDKLVMQSLFERFTGHSFAVVEAALKDGRLAVQ